MDPIAAALATGAAAAPTGVATQAVKEAFGALQWVLRARFPMLEVHVQALEARPASENKLAALAVELKETGAAQDADLLALAHQLLDAVDREAPQAAASAGVDLERVKAEFLKSGSRGKTGTRSRHRPPGARRTTSAPAVSFSGKEPFMRGSSKSRWRWEPGGEPLAVALRFHAWLLSDERNLRVGRALSTEESWSDWEQISADQRRQIAFQLRHWSINVSYPADGMAYVRCPLLHPDPDEPVEIPRSGVYDAYWITLVQQKDEWRIHSIDLRRPTPPQALGREPYS